ncbi:DUF4034 domain-containing protein [Stackebrandtia nassauensis]|uniref:DUF4034 domain-containing protein n=1 Tax=Stackebrandtia nassauensis (strain DSM 44728 / CIP 108903 / NRRL B-16338 / NBRC 102104 / LLR-40K-21) TaxID=446470 RepID=D3PVG3_STANL|nr:DUF4034 domain-containing protein [Stackebrandtia nassauensis]ADD43077.1 hypothetical protein Snas_3413 [Stackebrandtia nassauensis DSM 44728]
MGRFFGRRHKPADIPTHDPTFGDPKAAQLVSDLQSRDWRAVHNFLNVIQDPDDLQYYLDFCVEQLGVQAWIEDWIEAEPQSYLPFLVGGAHAVEWAWLGRGAALAKHTLPAQFQIFERRLRKAHELLEHAIARNPDDPTAWAALIKCGMGMSLGLEEATARFREAVARHRWHYGAHMSLLHQFLRKWGGSHELASSFALDTAANAPASSGLASMVVTASLEHWRMDLDEAESEKYLNSDETVAGFHTAADQSVRHLSYRRRLGWQRDFNMFAFAFWETDQWDAAGAMFDALGDQFTRTPWNFLVGESAEWFARARAEVAKHRS